MDPQIMVPIYILLGAVAAMIYSLRRILMLERKIISLEKTIISMDKKVTDALLRRKK